jgi:hypothetical protein
MATALSARPTQGDLAISASGSTHHKRDAVDVCAEQTRRPAASCKPPVLAVIWQQQDGPAQFLAFDATSGHELLRL